MTTPQTPDEPAASTSTDVAALEAEIAQLREQNAALAGRGGRRSFNGRAVGATALIVIATLLLPVALVGYWGQRTLLDTSQYVSTVAPLSQDPTIRLAVGDVISTQLQAQVNLEQRVSDLLPPQAKPLAGPIASGVHSFIDQQIQNFLASDAFSQLWVNVNQRAQQALVSALQGQPTGAVSIQGSQVVLDTGVIAEQVKAQLVARGLTVLANVPIPPPVDREIVLLDSPTLQQLRTIYAFSAPVAQWLIYAVAAMFFLGVLCARRRARTVLIIGVIVTIEAVLLRLGLAIGSSVFDNQLVGTPFEQASDAFYQTLTSYLQLAIRSLFVLGLVLWFAGWFAGGSSSSVATRAWVSNNLSGAGARTSSGPLAAVGAWVAPRIAWLRAIVLVIAAVVVLAQDRVTGAVLLWTLLVVLVALAILEFLAGAGRGAVAAPDSAPDSEAGSDGSDTLVGVTTDPRE